MGGKDTLRLPLNDRLQIGWKTCPQCFLVMVPCVVLPVLDGFENAGVIAPHPVLQINPGSVQLTRHAEAAIGDGLAEMPGYAHQFSRKLAPFQ